MFVHSCVIKKSNAVLKRESKVFQEQIGKRELFKNIQRTQLIDMTSVEKVKRALNEKQKQLIVSLGFSRTRKISLALLALRSLTVNKVRVIA